MQADSLSYQGGPILYILYIYIMHIFALMILPEFYTHLLEIQLRCFFVVVGFFRHQRVACRILAVPLAETMQHPNHWTTRKAPQTPCFTSAQLRPSALRSDSFFLASGMSPPWRQQSEPPFSTILVHPTRRFGLKFSELLLPLGLSLLSLRPTSILS